MKIGQPVEVFQRNGATLSGKVIARVSWDGPDDRVLVRYWAAPDHDPPRRAYRLVRPDELKAREALPESYLPVGEE